jgi:hypothetical protein
MMDPNSTVTHNEKLMDRVGNKRQYDVVIRGHFGGRPMLGVMECKDHSRKKGPDTVEAFAKKTENLGANLRVMVSKKGFTPQALTLAKHENIGCLSLLPDNPEQTGFSIGDWWYGVMRDWKNIHLTIHYDLPQAPQLTGDLYAVKWEGKQVVQWFFRELLTTHQEVTTQGDFDFTVIFDEVRRIEIEGNTYPVKAITCVAIRVYRKKRKFVSWSGDAFYDWHKGQFTIPDKGVVVGSAVETDMAAWPDYDGDIPEIGKEPISGLMHVVLYNHPTWDTYKDNEVPDIMKL